MTGQFLFYDLEHLPAQHDRWTDAHRQLAYTGHLLSPSPEPSDSVISEDGVKESSELPISVKKKFDHLQFTS